MLRAIGLVLMVWAAAGCWDLGDQPWEIPDAYVAASQTSPTPTPTPSTPVGDGGEDPTPSAGSPDAEAPCPHADGQADTVVVELVSTTFNPAVVTICVGDTVTWVNLDTKEHTIVTGVPGDPDGRIASERFYLGESFSYTFTEPGVYVYYCSTHKKKMRDAQVIVL